MAILQPSSEDLLNIVAREVLTLDTRVGKVANAATCLVTPGPPICMENSLWCSNHCNGGKKIYKIKIVTVIIIIGSRNCSSGSISFNRAAFGLNYNCSRTSSRCSDTH